ncbi:MAG: phosphoglycerate dehydrogenase [Bacilli bacterium]
MKILITSNSFGSTDKNVFTRLENAGFEIYKNQVGRIMNEGELIENLKDKDAVILGTENLTKSVIDECSCLKVVSRYGVGCDHVDVLELEKRGIKLEITKNANSNAVADHALALMLCLAHRINIADVNMKNLIWKKEHSRDLYGSNVGIIGLGAIGKGVAERVKGFGCKIYAFDKFYDEEFVKQNDIVKADLDTIYKYCDYVSLHIPSLPEYKKFINSEVFHKMKNSVYIINTARADLINHDDLYDALEKNEIGGYATDVYKDEPNIDEKLIDYNNTVLTPHMAAVTDGAIREMSNIAVENILKHFTNLR